MVRFQLWGNEPTVVDTAINELHGRLLAAKEDLRAVGFLRIEAESAGLAEPIATATFNAFRKTTDYRVLYEFHFEDTDGASSLISKIPATINDQFGESMTITDDMIRWDKTATPGLVIRGPFKLGGLTALAFIPGPVPSGTVTLTRTFDTAAGVPVVHPTLASFLTAVAGQTPTERHARVAFPTVSDFLGVFVAAGDPVELTGTIEGRVLNTRNGEYLERARVTVEGTQIETFTDSSGHYRLSGLPPGVYELIVHLAYDDDEMRGATWDHPNWGAAWRQSDLDLVKSAAFQEFLKQQQFKLMTWRELGKAGKSMVAGR